MNKNGLDVKQFQKKRVIIQKEIPSYIPVYKITDYAKRKEFKPPSKTWDEHLQIIKDMDGLVGWHKEIPMEVEIEIPTKLPIALVFSADWHLGMPGVDYTSFEKDVALWEQEKGLHLFIGGDGYHNIIQTSKIGSAHDQTPISVQKGLYVLTLKKLINQIIAIGTGNHNYWTALAEGEDWDAELSQRLNLVYTKHAGRIYLKVGKMMYPILRMHKSKFNSSFNLTHACKQYQRMYFPTSRIIVIEHQHMPAVEQYFYDEKECVAIRPGTYAVYDDYAQQNGFFGSQVSNPTLVLYPNEDRIVAFKDTKEAIVYLRAVRGETQ